MQFLRRKKDKLNLICYPYISYLVFRHLCRKYEHAVLLLVLQVGDQILEVNGRSFVAISHDEAVDILKTGYHLLMKVRDVGRLPHVRTIVDDTRWICSQAIAETSATANSIAVPNPTASADVPESMNSR